MSEWKETTLANVCTDISYGYTESAHLEKIGPKFLRITDISNERLNWDNVPFCPITDDNFIKYQLLPGDIVIARTGATTGANYTIKKNDHREVVFASYLIRYKIDKDLADPYFIGYILKSSFWKDYVDAIAGGSAQPGANAKQLGSYVVSLPPLDNQQKIVSVLSSFDDKIDLLHRQNATLEAMAETLFRQWFVEEAKEEWELATIGQFVKTNQNSITKDYQFQEIEYLDTSSLTEGLISSTQMIKLKDAPSRARRLVKHNDILISTVRPDQKHYGIINKPIENLVVSTGFCVISCTDINPYFIYLLLTNEEITGYLHSIAEGSTSTYPSLRPFDLEQIEFQMPPKEKISEFGMLASNYWDKININQTQIRTLTNLRDTLLPKLMSGEVRIN